MYHFVTYTLLALLSRSLRAAEVLLTHFTRSNLLIKITTFYVVIYNELTTYRYVECRMLFKSKSL